MCIRDSNNILKLDTIDTDYIHLTDRPTGHYEVQKIIEGDVYKRQPL